MSNTSFEKSLDIRCKSLEELQEPELTERFVLEKVAEINKGRKSKGLVSLYLDENCCEAASNSFQSIGNFQSLLSSNNVIGSDFSHFYHENNITLTPTSSMSQNTLIFESFLKTFDSVDKGNIAKLLDPAFNAIGMSVKRNFGSFKIVVVVFKKSIIVNHAEFDVNSGIKISGKMADPYSCIFAIIIKDSKDSVKPTIAGPKRIILKQDFKDFEALIPRMMLTSRSASEKYLEFFTIKTDPRSIGFGTGQDLTSIPPDASLAHCSKILGLWESNLMFENRNLTESQTIREEYERKVGSKIMVQNITDFKSRGRGRGSSIPSSSRNEWGNKGTPWKNPVSGLSTIKESNVESEMAMDHTMNNKENFVCNVTGFRDSAMGRDLIGRENGMRSEVNMYQSGGMICPSPNNPFAATTTPMSMNNGLMNMSNGPMGMSNGLMNMNNGPMGMSNGGGNLSSYQLNNPLVGVSSGPMSMSNASMNMNMNMNTNTNNHFMNPNNVPLNTFNNMNTHQFPNFISQNNPASFYQTLPQNNFSSHPMLSHNYSNTFFSHHSPQNQFFPQNHLFFNHPALDKPQDLLFKEDQCPSNLHGINSLPFTLKGPNSSSFYPIDNKEKKKAKVKVSAEGTQTAAEPDFFQNLKIKIPARLKEELLKVKPENESYLKLYENMEHSDIIVRVKETDLKAHKTVLYSCSQYFREQFDKSRHSSLSLSSKLVLPSWISLEGFKVVLKFMYTSCLGKESICLKLAEEVLQIADFLSIPALSNLLIVQFILPQMTKEEVLSVLKIAVTREKDLTEGWEYLIDSCLHYIGLNSNTIVRNFRNECLSLPVQCIIRIVNSSMRFLTNLDHASLVIKLLTDCHFAQCIFELTQKISNLYLLGYNNYYVDIQRLDSVRPLKPEQVQKLDPKINMEYPLIEEKDPVFLTTCRSSKIPAKKILESINQVQSYGKTTTIIPKKELEARGRHSFKIELNDLFRPKNVMSKCFSTDTRVWSLLIETSKEGNISIFLCERGPAKNLDNFISVLFTSVLFEVEIEDEGVKSYLNNKNQSSCLAGFYCFPSNQHQMVGERNFCKVSNLKSSDSVVISVYIREVGIHAGLLHYLCENFLTLSESKSEKFIELDCYNMKYLLSHDYLNVTNEREAVATLWKYCANKHKDVVDLLVSEIRLGFLSTKDLMIMARDHAGFRSSSVFKFIFKEEFKRRVGKKKTVQNPRKKYENLVEKEDRDYENEIVDWVLEDNHHAGYVERIAELKKKVEEQKIELGKLKSENDKKKGEENRKFIEFRPEPEKDYQLEFEARAEAENLYNKNCGVF